MVYLIRKSWMDETNEYGRCNDVDVAISICPAGFNVYDEVGNIMHTSIAEDKYKFGKKWVELKTNIEKELIEYAEKPFVLSSLHDNNRVKKYACLLEEVLILMNATEVEDSKGINYESLWIDLKEKVEKDLNYHKSGEMQSVAESVQGERKCNEFLDMMKDLENEGVKDE